MKKTGLALGGLAVLLVAQQAAAQTAAVEEITVTAQRREQNLQDTPVAVSAFSAQALEKVHVETTTSLINLVPNMSGGEVTGAGGANNYTLRGLYNADTSATVDNPVGTYIDGIYIARINGNNFSFFDVDRVEVLRGPQGTLFGRNTTGGAVNITLKRPSDQFGGVVEAEGGNYDHFLLRASVDVPLSDKFLTRTSAFKEGDDGWLPNTVTHKSNNAHDDWGVREALLGKFSDNITWYGTVDYIGDKNPDLPASKDANGNFYTTSGLQALGSIVTGAKGSIPGNFYGVKTLGLASTFDINTGLGNFEVITAFRHLDNKFNVDYFEGPSAIGGYDSVQNSNYKQFSQEVKLTGTGMDDRLNYTAGLFYLGERGTTDATAVFNAGGTPLLLAPDETYFNTVDSYAAYAQFDYKFMPQWVATAGLRYTYDKKTIDWQSNGNPKSVLITDAYLNANGIPTSQTESLATPHFAIEWHPDQDFMAYASATRGFRSGGWNVRGTNYATLSNFLPEKVWSYETGFRAETWEHRLRLNTTFFYANDNALQIPTASTSINGAPQFPTGNFADLHSYGVEIESTLVPVVGLNLTGSIGYDKTEYANYTSAVLNQQTACLASLAAGAASRPNCAAGIVTATGALAIPARAPKFTSSLGASYDIVSSDSLTLTPAVSWRHTSSQNTNAAQIAQAYQGAYDMVSASFTTLFTQKRIAISAGCDNCTNTAYLLSFISGHYWYNHPRTWFVKTNVKF